MLERLLACCGVLLVALVASAPAHAVPTMDPLKPCYVTAGTATEPQAEGINLRAQGFTPNSKVDLTIDGQPVPDGANLQTDASGALGMVAALPPVPAPFIGKGSRDFTVALTEVGNPVNAVTATAKTTALDVALKPKSAAPAKRVRFKALGFTAPEPVYAHYAYKGRLRKTVRMARKTGTCGSWRVRRPQIPIADVATGRWTVQFDQSKRYITDPAKIGSSYVRLEIRVTRRRA